jgi:hypothetical protein
VKNQALTPERLDLQNTLASDIRFGYYMRLKTPPPLPLRFAKQNGGDDDGGLS